MKATNEMVDAAMVAFLVDGYTCNRTGVEVCLDYALKALADRPPKMLSDDEILKITHAAYCTTAIHDKSYARAIEAAHIAKQSEPDTVPFDYEKWSKGGWQAIDSKGEDAYLIKPQENYTMRKSA